MTRGLFIVSWGFSELFGAMPNLVSYLESPITPLLSPSTLQPLAFLKLAHTLLPFFIQKVTLPSHSSTPAALPSSSTPSIHTQHSAHTLGGHSPSNTQVLSPLHSPLYTLTFLPSPLHIRIPLPFFILKTTLFRHSHQNTTGSTTRKFGV